MEKTMFRDGLMKGERILVTGGGTGLGKAMTEAFMELGAHCIIWGRRGGVLEETAAELSETTGGTCETGTESWKTVAFRTSSLSPGGGEGTARLGEASMPSGGGACGAPGGGEGGGGLRGGGGGGESGTCRQFVSLARSLQ